MTTTPLLVAYDGSVDARRALSWTAAESLRTGSPVHVIAVDEVMPAAWAGLGPTAVFTEGYVMDCSGLLEEAEKLLLDEGVQAGITTEQRDGSVVNEIVRAAASASAVVIGSRGHGPVGEALLGSVSQHVARHAPCPVVVVREQHTSDARRIVVGVDGSPESLEALAYACRRAADTGETVVALHGVHVRARSTDVWSADARSVDLGDRERLLEESVAGPRDDHPDVRIEQEVVAVKPEHCLADASGNASLVVVGSRGLGWFSGLLLGSVSQAVLQRATCPVVVLR